MKSSPPSAVQYEPSTASSHSLKEGPWPTRKLDHLRRGYFRWNKPTWEIHIGLIISNLQELYRLRRNKRHGILKDESILSYTNRFNHFDRT